MRPELYDVPDDDDPRPLYKRPPNVHDFARIDDEAQDMRLYWRWRSVEGPLPPEVQAAWNTFSRAMCHGAEAAAEAAFRGRQEVIASCTAAGMPEHYIASNVSAYWNAMAASLVGHLLCHCERPDAELGQRLDQIMRPMIMAAAIGMRDFHYPDIKGEHSWRVVDRSRN